MAYLSYKAKTPGSLMLFGEHAVLHHKQALVAAINHYMQVKLVPRTDDKIKIIAARFQPYTTRLGKFKIIHRYRYVLTAIQHQLASLPGGFTLNIAAEFPSNIGFGSSAAVTVATLGVLNWWLAAKQPSPSELYRQALRIVRVVQGCGSGADVAASIFGGLIAYKQRPLTLKKLSDSFPLVAIYSGSKTPTATVIAKVEHTRHQFPTLFAHLYNAMDRCTKQAITAIKNHQWQQVGKLMDIHQGLQDALGVNNAALAKLVFALRAHPRIYGAKISGAGLGDCVIGLGKLTHEPHFKNKIDIAISPSGIIYL